MGSSGTRTGLVATACLLALVGCGGGDGGSSPAPVAPAPAPAVPPPPPPPQPPPPAPPPVIGADGGTVAEASGAQAIFPAGVVTTDTTFRIAVDSTGAPPLPDGLTAAGNMYVITPHGGEFGLPVEVRIPVPNVTLLPTQTLGLAKAQPGGHWELLDSAIVDGKLTAKVNSFSIFATVVVNYPLPILQAVPFKATISFDCGEQDCQRLFGPATIRITATGNGGQLPEICRDQEAGLQLVEYASGVDFESVSGPLPTLTTTLNTPPSRDGYANFGVYLTCGGVLAGSWWNHARWDQGDPFPSLSIKRMPQTLDVVEGLQANLDAMLMGGAVGRSSNYNSWAFPSMTDRAIVEWQRSDDGGSSWRTIAHSYQDEASPTPFGTGAPWFPWGVRHGFIARSTDQGALIRIHACYTPPAPETPPPCVTSAATQINVLQHSSLPSISESPRSVLIRAGETANFSVTASGLPAPTLQWQTRPANSTGDWTNVTAGSGATGASYTTAPRMVPDNGEQYRVVVTNALGSAASGPVTVSVSDLVVAPRVTTQPASLSVASGSDAVFGAVVYGTEALSYQWRFNGTNIDGANSPILRLTGVTNANAGNYSLYASNAAGNVTSNTATLQVSAGTPAAVAPSIVTQPVSVVANVGNTATFAVGVDGTGPLSFQWRRDGVNIPGATHASLTFPSVALPNAGVYSVVVSNSAGNVVSNTVTLDVQPAVESIAPSITSQPSTVIVPIGGSALLAVGATGSGPLSYQWNLDGAEIPGANLPVLSLTNVGNMDVGDYTVTVSNSVSSVVSQVAEVILLGAPTISQGPVATTGIAGNTATFTVSAYGSALQYQWLKNGEPIPGATEASYTTPTLIIGDTGAVFSVVIYNRAGLVTSQGAVLTVEVVFAPSFLQQPSNVSVDPGESATLCVAFGGSLPMMAYLQRWTGTWTNNMEIIVSGDQVNCFFTAPLQLAESGAQFRFLAVNAAGQTATDTVTVTVTEPVGLSDVTLVSRALAGGVSNHNATNPSISADGRYVAFNSFASDLIAGFPQPPMGMESNHAFLRDLVSNTTTLINQTTSGGVSTHDAVQLRLSANGRYALFASLAADQVADDTNGSYDVFWRNLQTGTTVRVNLLPNGNQIEGAGNGSADWKLGISGNGRFVTFMSAYDVATESNGDPNDGYYLYIREVQSGYTQYIDGAPTATRQIMYVAISDDGEWVAYERYDGTTDTVTVVLYDAEADDYYEVYSYVQGTFPAGARPGIAVSANGRYVAFALNVPSITGSTQDQVMLVDRENPGVATVVSTGMNGAGDGPSSYPRISGDGRYVLFETAAPNLTGGLALPWQRYPVIRDTVAGATSFATHRMNGNPMWIPTSSASTISSDGSTVAFVAGYNEVNGDGSQATQIFAEPRQ